FLASNGSFAILAVLCVFARTCTQILRTRSYGPRKDAKLAKSRLTMKRTTIACCVLAIFLLIAPRLDSKPIFKTTYLTVAAGNVDRRESIVTFVLPQTLKAGSYALRDDADKLLAVQIDSDGTAAFILPELKASATKRFHLEEISEGGIQN